MTEIDQLKVIKSKEDEKKKAISELTEEMEKQLQKKKQECAEKVENIENQIINDYNKGIDEIKESESNKMADILETQKAKAAVMDIRIPDKTLHEKVYNMIIDYIKKSD
jgi:vacuolar-type H+-ATPase subunit H